MFQILMIRLTRGYHIPIHVELLNPVLTSWNVITNYWYMVWWVAGRMCFNQKNKIQVAKAEIVRGQNEGFYQNSGEFMWI